MNVECLRHQTTTSFHGFTNQKVRTFSNSTKMNDLEVREIIFGSIRAYLGRNNGSEMRSNMLFCTPLNHRSQLNSARGKKPFFHFQNSTNRNTTLPFPDEISHIQHLKTTKSGRVRVQDYNNVGKSNPQIQAKCTEII
ncbi:hypothetical protein DM860_016132 [Cuscuta australis]|uniref:Uncharacterized protein n=1 Tax=Cuscuta australis TaxID=267555 RepID=A0A328E732_9ASTE|nr:hypothetical protein DM860_016132 [Cuscuta australis]